jgi:ABC-2 type transport system permease protein/oleandomycin transport system permease protein
MASVVAEAEQHPASRPTGVPNRPALAWFFTDAIAMARRYVIGMIRTPDVIAFVIVQPIIFVLLFRYIFGGSIHIPGVSYVNFLICGLIVQTVAFSSQPTAVALASDLHNGIVERFRSLAMSRAAVLAGRSLSDAIRYAFASVLMIAIGYSVGLRLHATAIDVVAAIGLLALFGLSMSCLMAFVAFSLKSAEAAVAASFPILGLLVFPSNVYASPQTMPEPLRAYAIHQPVSAVADAVRALLLGGPTASPLIKALGWTLGIAAVFGALAVHRYRKAV